ncbi:MAG: hypothetical protein HOV94_13540 [Saccharothrix sp.]|nr:hypothetical protein [Saccharothrix sp.]
MHFSDRSDALGVVNGVTLVLGREALGHLVSKLAEGLSALDVTPARTASSSPPRTAGG